jgi:23S rRNA (guanosine2251-2'-O)-methyltransferase
MKKLQKSMKKRNPSGERRRNSAVHGENGPQNAWLYGWHTVRAALANPRRGAGRLLATPEAVARLRTDFPDAAPETVDRAHLDALLPKGAVHQGIAFNAPPLGEMSLDEFLEDPAEDALLVVLDQVTDPHNVGAILRSAAAFGAAAVIVHDRSTPPTTGVLAKAASGALDIVPLLRVGNLARALEALGREGFWRVGFDSDAEGLIADAPLDGRTALVLGAEGSGLRRLTREACDNLVRIPATGPLASLNVSNAAAIALYEAAQRRTRPETPA